MHSYVFCRPAGLLHLQGGSGFVEVGRAPSYAACVQGVRRLTEQVLGRARKLGLRAGWALGVLIDVDRLMHCLICFIGLIHAVVITQKPN